MGKRITINGMTVDPLAQQLALSAADLHAADASESNYVLIQTQGPLSKNQKAELATKGVVILEYVPDETYICEFKPTDLESIRSLSFVEWANVYMRGFKINPALTTATGAAPGSCNLLEMALTVDEGFNREPKKVDIVLHDGIDPKTVVEQVASAVGLDPGDIKSAGRKIRLKVEEARLEALASLDQVRHLEPVFSKKLHNDIARQILHLDANPAGPIRLEGEGQIVAVADTGLDKGSTIDVHPAFFGRVLKLYGLGRGPNKTNDPHGHGTHVAGSVLGDGNSAVLGHSVRGTAPKAKLILQSVIDSFGGLGGLPDDLHGLFAAPYQDGARVHSNSWGSTLNFGVYDSNANELDDFVWNHRDCVICFAAGNDGADKNDNGIVDSGSVAPPATAKNCIAVGASENNRPNFPLTYGRAWPGDFPKDPLFSDKTADSPEGMVAFSSRGPTNDGRIRPDVVAPGTYVLSTRSRATSGTGFGLSNDPLYMFDSGTSMACPLVAGCAAIVREFLIKERGMPEPSAALVKALLMNGARNLNGQYVPTEAGPIPNNDEGFGIVDMAATLGPLTAAQIHVFKDEANALDSEDEERLTVQVPEGAEMLKVTLVWTDPPGETLQNDLDLIVRTADGQEWHGNAAPGSSSFDRKNNVEQVIWQNVPAGHVEIVVKAYRIVKPQSYALVARTA
ncbi:MAG: S8 family serine peptidase [Desulfomonile tiedjei]|uniref:S8 family serine peptidase n=1 Tax=Desulfomonile tiedjei TaxID=2358 RepID=A0A9D6Z5T8_9BACT|nr:S8 family serine peptidase [Desulfomonile tiedjei]